MAFGIFWAEQSFVEESEWNRNKKNKSDREENGRRKRKTSAPSILERFGRIDFSLVIWARKAAKRGNNFPKALRRSLATPFLPELPFRHALQPHHFPLFSLPPRLRSTSSLWLVFLILFILSWSSIFMPTMIALTAFVLGFGGSVRDFLPSELFARRVDVSCPRRATSFASLGLPSIPAGA